MAVTTYPVPKPAHYRFDGTFRYPVLVLGERRNYGRIDYRICLEHDRTLSQYVSASKLTFTNQEDESCSSTIPART